MGPAIHHYKCHLIWTLSISSTRIVKIVKWCAHNFKIPRETREQLVLAADKDLKIALKSKQATTHSFPISIPTQDTLIQLAAMFSHKSKHKPDTAVKSRVPPSTTNGTSISSKGATTCHRHFQYHTNFTSPINSNY